MVHCAGSIHEDLGTLLNNVSKVSQEESINLKNFKEINTTTKDSSEKCRKITNNMKAVVQQLLQQHRKVLEIQKLDKSHTKLYCAKKRYHFSLLSNMKNGTFSMTLKGGRRLYFNKASKSL